MPCPLCEAGHRPEPVILINPFNNPFHNPYMLQTKPHYDMIMLKLKPEEVKTYNTYKPPLEMIEGSYKNRKGRRYRKTQIRG